jgi:hypothetical protein
MAQMRLVELKPDAKQRGITSSIFQKDGIAYRIENANAVAVNSEVAAAWATADTNVTTLVER